MQLEIASFLGIFCSLLLFLADQRHAMIWAFWSWFFYISIVDLKAPMIYHYGWEWETCELGFVVFWFLGAGIFVHQFFLSFLCSS